MADIFVITTFVLFGFIAWMFWKNQAAIGSLMQDDEKMASYCVKQYAPSGQTLMEQSFSCNGINLKESLKGIETLKKLAEGKDKRYETIN